VFADGLLMNCFGTRERDFSASIKSMIDRHRVDWAQSARAARKALVCEVFYIDWLAASRRSSLRERDVSTALADRPKTDPLASHCCMLTSSLYNVWQFCFFFVFFRSVNFNFHSDAAEHAFSLLTVLSHRHCARNAFFANCVVAF